ncbi:MAG: porin family protein [Gallionella sp.]
MKKIAAAVLLSAVVAAPAFAADEGFYAGLALGNGKPGVSPSALAVSKSSDFIYGGLAGYQYNKNLAVEAQFTGVGKSRDVAGSSLKADALSLTAVGLLPLNDSFELLGKLGVASAKTKSSAAATNLGATRTGLTYGIGAQYNVNQNLGLRLVWDRYALATSNATTGVKTNANADVVTVAAVYKF